jgi:hypothetical protein
MSEVPSGPQREETKLNGSPRPKWGEPYVLRSSLCCNMKTLLSKGVFALTLTIEIHLPSLWPARGTKVWSQLLTFDPLNRTRVFNSGQTSAALQ